MSCRWACCQSWTVKGAAQLSRSFIDHETTDRIWRESVKKLEIPSRGVCGWRWYSCGCKNNGALSVRKSDEAGNSDFLGWWRCGTGLALWEWISLWWMRGDNYANRGGGCDWKPLRQKRTISQLMIRAKCKSHPDALVVKYMYKHTHVYCMHACTDIVHSSPQCGYVAVTVLLQLITSHQTIRSLPTPPIDARIRNIFISFLTAAKRIAPTVLGRSGAEWGGHHIQRYVTKCKSTTWRHPRCITCIGRNDFAPPCICLLYTSPSPRD